MPHLSISRRGFLEALSSAAACALAPRAYAATPPPNFVIILADDMGYDSSSAYGGWIKTPVLERMAREGMKFTDFHSSGAVCSPTRAGLLTGRYQERAGIPDVVYATADRAQHYTGLQAVELTFAEMLRDAGYATGLFGKWHLGYYPEYNPVHHGFDSFRGYVSGNVDFHSHYDNETVYDWWHQDEKVHAEGYVTHLVTKNALEFIDTHAGRPFCLYVAHEAVHDPFQAPASPILRGPRKGQPEDAPDLATEEIYSQMMTEMDKGIGAILDKLESLGIAENTLVFFFSDNGQAANAPRPKPGVLRGQKGTVWEGGHRVPAIAWWPGSVPAGSVNEGTYISLDLMPTMLALAGLPMPTNRPLDGIPLDGALLRGEPAPVRPLFWRGEAMREGPWKLVEGRDGGLFNLAEDLGERKDLSAAYPERVQEMRAALEAWRHDVARTATPQPERPKQ